MNYTPARIFYAAIAALAVAIGSIGLVVPLLPTTPFVLIAGWGAARSSDRFRIWLLHHPRFGPIINNWREQRAIPRRQKVQAVGLVFLSWVTLAVAANSMTHFLVGSAVLCIVTIFLTTRPEPRIAGGPMAAVAPMASDVPMTERSPQRADYSANESGRLLGLRVPIGIGTMMWGNTPVDRRINGRIIPTSTLAEIRRVTASAGLTFIDTAEGYGGGTCELRVRKAGFSRSAEPVIATKFLPTLWRWTPSAVVGAIRRSNRRLGVACCDLYFIHSPIHPRSPDVWIRGAARAKRLGLVRRVGVSNFNAAQIARACEVAAREGISIVANQIMFSLLVYDARSLRETVDACRARGIAVVGYGPLGQGLLVDGLTEQKARRIRLSRMAGITYRRIQPLRTAVDGIARRRGRTMAEVCIAWSIRKGVVPLVGTRSVEHVSRALGAVEFSLTAEEVEQLDSRALSHSTFDRPRRRRMFFVVFISLLMQSYRISRAFAARHA